MEGTKSEAMASRSFRIRRDTLAVLEEQAKIRGLGITVYIRKVLESLVDNIETEKLVAEHELESASLRLWKMQSLHMMPKRHND